MFVLLPLVFLDCLYPLASGTTKLFTANIAALCVINYGCNIAFATNV